MTRATDNAAVELWRIQSRLGIRPADRRLPATNDNADTLARELEAVRREMGRA